jgi:hypothetical protein
MTDPILHPENNLLDYPTQDTNDLIGYFINYNFISDQRMDGPMMIPDHLAGNWCEKQQAQNIINEKNKRIRELESQLKETEFWMHT